MFEVKSNMIECVRGDSGVITFNISKNGQPYEMQPGDKITMSCSSNIDSEPIISIESTTNVLNIPSTETTKLPCGRLFADVEIRFADGDVKTVIYPFDKHSSNMIVHPDVTR